MALLPIALAAVLSAIFLVYEHFSGKAEKYHQELISFSTGMLITIIFVEIFPTIGAAPGEGVYVALLLGFVIYHLIERYIYQHTEGKKTERRLGRFHMSAFFVENFINGFVFAILIISQKTGFFAYLVFLAFLVEIIAASMSLRHILEHFRFGNKERIGLSLSVLAGAATASVVALSTAETLMLLAFFTGFLLYFVVRDALPLGRRGKPVFFTMGVVLVLLLLEILPQII